MGERGSVKVLADLISEIGIAMLTTVAPDGTLRSRPMATQRRSFDGTLYFFTSLDTAKADEVRLDQHVNLAYADPKKDRYVSVVGSATISQDRRMMEQLWEPHLKTWFPKGLDQPDIALLAVRVRSAEYWDSPAGATRRLADFFQEHIAGEPKPRPEHGHVEIE